LFSTQKRGFHPTPIRHCACSVCAGALQHLALFRSRAVRAGRLLHLLFTPEHFEEWIGYGLFFLVAGLAQLLFVVVVLRQPTNRSLLIAGIAGNALIVGLWIATRTLGVPLGPEAGEVEEIGVVDTLSKLTELALIGCLFILLRHAKQTYPPQSTGRHT
jgi:hypothetical protein